MQERYTLETRQAQPTLVIKFRSPAAELSKRFEHVYSTIAQHLERTGQSLGGPPFAIYHNMDMNDLSVEAGFSVTAVGRGEGEVVPSELPPGQVAVTIHEGPYERVEATYNGLMSWLGQQGYDVTGPFCEYYLNDPADTPSGELKTRIVVPVSKR